MIDPEDGQKIYRHAIHSKVLVVGKMRIEGTWRAYCFPVPGVCHREEWQRWRTDGAPLPEPVARAIFGFLEEVPYSP